MKKIILALAASTALFAAAGAQAQGYIGASAGIGQMDADIDCEGASECDDSSGGGKLYAGFKVSENVAFEGSYTKFGKFSASGGGTSLDITGTSFGISVVMLGDLSPNLTGALRLGVASNKTKLDVSVPGGGGSDEESNVAASFGLALGYRVTKALSIEGGIDFSQFEYDDLKADGRLFSIGLKYEF